MVQAMDTLRAVWIDFCRVPQRHGLFLDVQRDCAVLRITQPEAIPAAIHVTPESVHAGPISKLQDGDVVRVDSLTGRLDVLVDEDEFAARVPSPRVSEEGIGTGRELFAAMRGAVGRADEGAHVFGSLGRLWEKADAAPFLTHEETR